MGSFVFWVSGLLTYAHPKREDLPARERVVKSIYEPSRIYFDYYSGNFETHIRLQFNLNPFDIAATGVVSEFGTKAGSVTYKQGADNPRAGTHWVGEQLSVNYRAQPEWAVRRAIE
jgi:hypothetical protein